MIIESRKDSRSSLDLDDRAVRGVEYAHILRSEAYRLDWPEGRDQRAGRLAVLVGGPVGVSISKSPSRAAMAAPGPGHPSPGLEAPGLVVDPGQMSVRNGVSYSMLPRPSYGVF